MSDDDPVPAARLGVLAGALGRYLELEPRPWPESISAREAAQEHDFASLPFAHPMAEVLDAPLRHLGVVRDHLTRLAQATRVPVPGGVRGAVRELAIAAATAAYLADPKLDARERVRRVMSDRLQVTTEQMRLVGRDGPEDRVEYARLDKHRRDVVRGARTLGWQASDPETALGSSRPEHWWIGDPPPSEIDLAGPSDPDPRTPDELTLTCVKALDPAMEACIALYGWPDEPWRSARDSA